MIIRNNPEFNWLKKEIERVKSQFIILLAIILLLPIIYFVVYQTGGIKFVYSHFMYIPIVLSGIFFGLSVGGLTGLVSGLLLGPLMPLDTVTLEMQQPLNWIFRLFIFVMVGIIIGYASTRLRHQIRVISDVMSTNQETKVPNTNRLKTIKSTLTNPSYTVFTILIGNHNSIVDILGIEIYHQLIHEMYNDLNTKIPEIHVFHADSDKLWVLIPSNKLEDELKRLLEVLLIPKVIKNVPLYVDFSVGGSTVYNIANSDDLRIFEYSYLAARHAQMNNVLYALGYKDKFQKRSEYELLASFTKALNNHETYLVFQPKIDVRTNKLCGLEALTRWRHPEKGEIYPDVFIPLVEETKLIHVLTFWVLENAINMARDLTKKGKKVPISINVSAKNLFDPTFFDNVVKIINKSRIPVDLIEFEITESTLMVNPEKSKEMLQKFVDFGIKIYLDDFGSGYSSLAYLGQYPLNYIKIDRLFIQKLNEDKTMSTIVDSTIKLSKSLGYEVVVEGVETKEVYDLVTEYGTDYVQGYFYSKPLKEKDLITFINNNY